MLRQVSASRRPEGEKSQAPSDIRRYLIFRLGSEQYGIAVLSVREIIRTRPVTEIPHSPSYLAGVINLRGKIVPVLDLRRRFGMPPATELERCCIVVVDSHGGSETTAAGIAVDEVLEVTNIGASEIEQVPEFDRNKRPEITGIAKTESDIRILLDPDEVLCCKSWQSRAGYS
jgi:purine-binding chemotaxis protein CheW